MAAPKSSSTPSGAWQLVAAATAVTDPGGRVLVTVTNGRTNVSSAFSVASGAPFSLYLFGLPGDPISVHARDSHTFPLQSAEVAVGTLPANSGVGSITFQPSSLAGGARTVATVTLATPAPAGGALIGLTSSNATVAPVRANITVASGLTTATFTITTTSVAVQTNVNISASYVGTSQSGTLTVVHDANPPAVTITRPLAGAIITEGQPIVVEATIIDAEVGVKQATAVMDGVSYPMTLDAARANVWTATITAPDVDPPSDVPNAIAVTASDFENNVSPAVSVTINIHPIIDPLAPALAWTCNTPGAIYPIGAVAKLQVFAKAASGDSLKDVSVTITCPNGTSTVAMASAGNDNYFYNYTIPTVAADALVTLQDVPTTFGTHHVGLPGSLTNLT